MLLGAGINLSGTLWSAAERIRKIILRGFPIDQMNVYFPPIVPFGRFVDKKSKISLSLRKIEARMRITKAC